MEMATIEEMQAQFEAHLRFVNEPKPEGRPVSRPPQNLSLIGDILVWIFYSAWLLCALASLPLLFLAPQLGATMLFVVVIVGVAFPPP